MINTCRVDKLFSIQYGNGLELTNLTLDDKGYNFIARGMKDNGISAKVSRVYGETLFPAGTITVAVSGSVMESFLQPSPYYTAYHVMILTPLMPMTDAEKLFYCMCLRRNKFKYSYGRQANETLPSLIIPDMDAIPDYVKNFSISDYGEKIISESPIPELNEFALKSGSSEMVPLGSLFDVINGVSSTSVIKSDKRESYRWIPFVRPSYRQSTSIDSYVDKLYVPQNKVFPRGTLYVSTNGQGSHTFSYVSVSDFVPNSDVSVLIPKRPMCLREKLAYSLFITKNRFKFSYGRKPKGDKLKAVLLPKEIPQAWNNADLTHFGNSLQ